MRWLFLLLLMPLVGAYPGVFVSSGGGEGLFVVDVGVSGSFNGSGVVSEVVDEGGNDTGSEGGVSGGGGSGVKYYYPPGDGLNGTGNETWVDLVNVSGVDLGNITLVNVTFVDNRTGLNFTREELGLMGGKNLYYAFVFSKESTWVGVLYSEYDLKGCRAVEPFECVVVGSNLMKIGLTRVGSRLPTWHGLGGLLRTRVEVWNDDLVGSVPLSLFVFDFSVVDRSRFLNLDWVKVVMIGLLVWLLVWLWGLRRVEDSG